jgi:hypothetical protein
MKLEKKLHICVANYCKLIDKIKIVPENDKIELYQDIKTVHNEYLYIKGKLRDEDSDLTDNPDILKFKEYKQILVAHEREMLLKDFDFKEKLKTNSNYLNRTVEINTNTTKQLFDSIKTVQDTIKVGSDTAENLADDREKMMRISKDLDETESELQIAGKLITRNVKRLYTDKIIIGFTTLLVAAATGLGLYGGGIIKL